MNRDEQKQLFGRRKKVIGRLLTRASRAYQEIVTANILERTEEVYRIGDNAVFVHLETKGNRISELAKRSGLTKQALSQLVADLEKRGLVKKEKDPSDGRALIIRYTDRGLALLVAGVKSVEEQDRKIIELLGDADADAFRRNLEKVAELLDPDGF